MGKIKTGMRLVKDMHSALLLIKQQIDREQTISNYKSLLSNQEVYEYLYSVKKLMTVMDIKGSRYVRIGDQEHSGGYVMLDDLSDKSIFYSFGISEDVTWDSYFAEILKRPVYMYDHTINSLPYEHGNFKWRKIGICGENEKGKKADLKSLTELLTENGNTKDRNMILKMDVEGAEWDVFSSIPAEVLQQFDQITMEMHWFLDFNLKNKIIKSLEVLNTYHQLVHIHGNCGDISIPMDGYNMPNILEATYVNRMGRHFVKSERFFPTSLDKRNDDKFPEIILGSWN